MNHDEFKLMITVLKLYYELGLSQEEIAQREHISKSTVSRVIKRAVEQGYIEYKINYTGEPVQMLEQRLWDEFGVECIVLPSYVEEYLIRLNDVCNFAAKDIACMIEEDETIGVTWGRTTEYLAKNLVPPAKKLHHLKVCMLSGFVTGTIASMKASHIIERFAEVYSAKGYMMPAPLLADSEQIAKTILSDSNIKYVMNRCVESQFVILSIGGNDLADTFLTDFGTYSLSTFNHLASIGAAGDIAGRSFDLNGNEIKSTISGSIISLPIEEIKKKKNRIGIAVGEPKARALIGALRGRILSRLYTDEKTAKSILELNKNLRRCI